MVQFSHVVSLACQAFVTWILEQSGEDSRDVSVPQDASGWTFGPFSSGGNSKSLFSIRLLFSIMFFLYCFFQFLLVASLSI